MKVPVSIPSLRIGEGVNEHEEIAGGRSGRRIVIVAEPVAVRLVVSMAVTVRVCKPVVVPVAAITLVRCQILAESLVSKVEAAPPIGVKSM